MSFTITKTASNNPDTRVHLGFSKAFRRLDILSSTGEVLKENAGIADIEVGTMPLLTNMTDYIRTTAVEAIQEQTPRKVVFRTSNSVYEIYEIE